MTKLKEGRYELKRTPEVEEALKPVIAKMRYECEQQRIQDDKDRILAEYITNKLRLISDYWAT